MLKFIGMITLLAALQTTPPIPRQTPNNLGSTPHNVESQADDKQKPSPPIAPIVPDAVSPQKEGTHGQTQNSQNGQNFGNVPNVFVTVNGNNDGNGLFLGIFTGLLVLVGIGQGVILWRQAGIMNNQFAITQPRLHVYGVRASKPFKDGCLPVIFVKVMNSGQIAANGVSISMRVEFSGAVRQYEKPQLMIIPANGWRECLIEFPSALNAASIADLDWERVKIDVRGSVKWKKEEIPYHYKYYPWPYTEKRPEGLRRFVPFDFSTVRQNVTVAPKGNQLTASAGSVSTDARNDTTEPPKKST